MHLPGLCIISTFVDYKADAMAKIKSMDVIVGESRGRRLELAKLPVIFLEQGIEPH